MQKKYATIAVDSIGELSRLFFSYDMKKSSRDMDKIRAINNYPGVTERLNMFVRALKQKRDAGVEIVFTAHEDIQKVYAKGGMMSGKGSAPTEPAAVKGQPDLPGNRTPDEFCRACDNVLHVRYLNGKPAWIAHREPIATGNEFWEVKDRFNGANISNGVFPPSYSELKTKVVASHPDCWQAPYIWVLYGPFGIGKTRSLLTFPKPILLFNLDLGTKSITKKEIEEAQMDIISDINVEESADYTKFMALFQGAV